MNIKEINELINLMNENNLMELEIEKEGMRIRLRKAASGTEAPSGPIVVEEERVRDIPPKQASEVSKEMNVKTVEMKSPMVGTFYRAPSPEAPPYVEVGQNVEPGQVVCIIEAMKLMNEIKSEIRGKILEVLVDNAEPIEFGQPIFLIEPL
ncbi:MAG: acetyl-CoA carboxylase, biotin carboxyl carrier protein [Candidatus Omnitrophica bacterium CG08_land_8_20_14_0_20_41_16]|uniref:Biotin carboxyl carrier protein of acetyl-CoA carboxylase n=1 Tax=Candidatus Sherwoodlollariibacterium unditelluris TaxID=1974757 RepID=A0A2G9YI08_9BACT|nr:MAG: acetyl-CoA carboxylase, biotin carboxyl carrier protein [Candidatus Omnitrophica bacterium CG23_combo_of_CG06-09_8_20_14_all_41_10]PIS33586.1 MAG: acetyl-CoA carboxylase, biotin carboxyl carrier protein [Candidatus Omnitrophica bacterium CG08_land_8_20_14_0_20_41_16]